ncbi:nuclear transport factor 2 family protein [Daejeonella lutea]|uniref:Putative lumazine-binding n=1 Tax=Daejeonella lutea TaxID=572036 RepID=A0A1T5FF17_9SPHI|nr:nuclear transport factor 2 family protein [Daejeonella lutea]SKB94696.1 Putative lumazine-binding [Daejeonella lutea]
MKRTFVLSLFLLASQILFAQQPGSVNEEVKRTVETLFQGMRKGDSAMVNSTFSKGIVMQTVVDNKGKIEVRSGDPAGFLKFVGSPHKEIYDERITFDRIQVDGDLANVWTSYKFYIGDKFSHCGVNSMTLVKEEGAWKLLHIIDTRRKENCP